jgi:glutathione S-transferase
MELYYGPVSGNSSRAVFGLMESGAPFTPHVVDTSKGENRTPAYLALNPMGRVPSFVDGPFRLWESNAINWYVAEKFPASRLVPVSLEGRASMQRWLFFQSAHLSPACAPVFRATNPRVQAFWRTTGDAKAAEGARNELGRLLPVLEQALTGRDYLERAFTLADVAHAPHLLLVRGGGFDFSPYPNLKNWLERIEARPAWKKTAELVFA